MKAAEYLKTKGLETSEYEYVLIDGHEVCLDIFLEEYAKQETIEFGEWITRGLFDLAQAKVEHEYEIYLAQNK